MTGKVYVANLPASATEIALRDKFAQLGCVLSVVIEPGSKTGRSNIFGYVEMSSEAEARAAIGRLNMTQYDDKVISVNMVRIRTARQTFPM